MHGSDFKKTPGATNKRTKPVLAGIMSMVGMIGLMISLGTIPMLLLYKPSTIPIRNIFILVVSIALFGISSYILKTPVSVLTDNLRRMVDVVCFIFIVSIGSHVVRFGFRFLMIEVLILLVSVCVLFCTFILYRSPKGKKKRKRFGL